MSAETGLSPKCVRAPRRPSGTSATRFTRAQSPTDHLRNRVSGLFDFDLARDHLQLRGYTLERLPGRGLALRIRGSRLIDEGTIRIG